MSGHVHSAGCSHGAHGKPKAPAAAQPRMVERASHDHVHGAGCAHGHGQEHEHAAAAPERHGGGGHQHGAGCSHGAGGHGSEGHNHEEEDITIPVYGRQLPECKTAEERAAAIEALPTPMVGDLIGKVRELWRLGKILFSQKSYPTSLHVLAEAVRLGCRWLMVPEGAKYWGEKVYNVFFYLPSVDKVDLAVFASWSHWWIIQQCVQTLQQQAQSLAREVTQQRINDIKALQKKFEATMLAVANNKELAAKRPQQTAVIWLALSVLHAHTRSSKEELRCAVQAVQCDAENAEVQLRCGNAMLETKDTKGASACFDRAIALFVSGTPEVMTAHLGAAYCNIGADNAAVLRHVRELRTLDLQFASVAALRFAVMCKELSSVWPDVLKEVNAQLARGGVCGWCLKSEADKRCSACNGADFCSPECFRAAWKGDAMFPAHKLVCVKK